MPTPANSGDDHVSVIKEYGWRPFVGGLAGLLLFKEVHAIKEESVLACLTLTGFYVAYIALGDKLIEAAEADEAKKRKLLADLSACEMAGLEMYEQKLKLPAHLPPLLEAMSKEHRETAERWVEYKNKQMRANFAAETLATLEKLKDTESAQALKVAGDTQSAVLNEVVKIFRSDNPKLQQEMLEWSLNNVGTRPAKKKVPIHPVIRVFNEVYANIKGKGN